MTVKEQLIALLRSRKTWALIAALATIWTTYATVPGAMTPLEAVQATVAALSGYVIATGLEGPRPPMK